MRFNAVASISFTDINGNSYNVKDIRPVTTFQSGQYVEYIQGTIVSEIITRPEYYGKNTEDLAWAVVDANIEKLVENNFDFSKIRRLFLPVIGGF